MTRASNVWVVLLTCLFVGSIVFAQEQSKDPKYVRRLELPARGEQFRLPRSVVADLHADEVFVCDSMGQRILIFDWRGVFQYQISGGDRFRTPADLAVDPEGYLFVAAQERIVQLDFDGLFLGEWQLDGLVEGTDAPRLVSIAIAPDGKRLFVLDEANLLLLILDRRGSLLGSFDFGEGLTEEEAQEVLFGHVDVYQDRVLVALPILGKIRMFDFDGNPLGSVGRKGGAPCHTMLPVAAALDRDGNMWILDKQRTLFMLWSPEENRCLGEHYGFGNAPGALYQPDDLALDSRGQLHISQGFEGRVQVYSGAAPAVKPESSDAP